MTQASPRAPLDAWTGVEAARFGVYVHFPYCLSKCPYCDFASTVAKEVPQARYAQAVLRELKARAGQFSGREVDSIYFGGGTPSLWSARWVGAVLDGIASHWKVNARAEVTLEANPGAADASRFADYRAAGIGRLSMGVQSFQPATLKALGREHDGETAVRAYEAARAAGFQNVSLDFIYGVHGQSLAQAEDDARRAAALGPEHLSAYALTLDAEALAEEVPLAKQLKRGEVSLPPDEQVTAMGHAVRGVYAAAGYARYEISNYARAGFHSRHNTLYWTGGEYLALGVGATGFFRTGAHQGTRYSNARSAERYLAQVEQGVSPDATAEPLGPRELFFERLAMGLRLTSGVDLSAVCDSFGEARAPREREVARLVDGGLARRSGPRVALTEAGLDVHSAICARLM